MTRKTTKEELLAAAKGWEKNAEKEECMAAWNRSMGLDLSEPGESAGDYRARAARRCAESLRKEAETEVPHCVCHVWPSSECPNRKEWAQ